MNIFSKIHSKVKTNIIVISIVIVLIPLLLIPFFPYKEYHPWKFEGSVVHIPFTTDDNGYMYIQASFNDTSGIFFLDTGTDITMIKESLLDNKDSLYSLKITDAQNISDRKNMTRVTRFKIGDIEFQTFRIWAYDDRSWRKEGFFYKKDSIIGVIGTNFLSNFICEFNMEKRIISVYKPNEYPENISDSLSVSFDKKGLGYFLEIEIDNKKHLVKFDSGSSCPLILKDTLTNSKKYFDVEIKSKRGNTKSSFSHLKKDTLKFKSSYYSIFPKVILGHDTIESVVCEEKAKTNLLGVPFFWSYENVVADYPNKKVYFINKQKESNRYDSDTHTHNFIRNSYLYEKGTFRIESNSYEKFDILLVSKKITSNQTEVTDTIPSLYKIYGESRWWGKSINNLDSILSMDSVQLPNGKVIYDDYKIYATNKYFYDN